MYFIMLNISISLYIPPPNSNGYGKLVKNDFSRTYERNVKSHTKNYAGHKMIKNVDWNSKAALFEGANIIKYSSEFQNCMVC